MKWAVAQGFTVFMISWVNPDAHYKDLDFEDYMKQGPLAAFDAVEKATGQKDINVIAYCLGGTLMAATLADGTPVPASGALCQRSLARMA